MYIYASLKSISVNWMYIVSNLMFPVSLMIVVGILSQGKLLPFALVGGLISITAMSGVNSIAYLASLRFDFLYRDLVVTTKTTKMDYMFAHLLGEFVWVVPSIAFYFILDVIYGLLTPYTFLMTLLLACMVSISSYSIAFWITSRIKHTRNAWPIGTVLSLLLITVSPTFYPYTYLPKYILDILTILPTTPAVVLAQGIFGLTPSLPIQWYMLPILFVETAAYLLIAVYTTQWVEK